MVVVTHRRCTRLPFLSSKWVHHAIASEIIDVNIIIISSSSIIIVVVVDDVVVVGWCSDSFGWLVVGGITRITFGDCRVEGSEEDGVVQTSGTATSLRL